MKSAIAVLVLGVTTFGAAQAADNGIYLGASIGQSKLKPDESRLNFSSLNYDDKDQGYKLIAGIRPLNWLGAEINYVDLGRTDGVANSGRVRSDAKLYDASVVGFYPLPFVDLFAKAGIARSRAQYRQDGISELKLDSTDFTWGAGVQARFGSLAARLEYERFNLPQTNRASLISLGVTWTFF